MRGKGPAWAVRRARRGLLGCILSAALVVALSPHAIAASMSPLMGALKVGDHSLVHPAKTCTFTENSLQPLPCQEDQNADGGGTTDGGTTDGPPTGGTTTPAKRTFAYHPPGKLHASDLRTGRADDRRVYLPDMAFPIDLSGGQHPHMNSQIFGYGGGGWGGKGAPGGTECDTRNYDPFTQRDNFCEVRSWPMPFCPSGSGHQGQDIRPPTCANRKWMAVAAADGVITYVSSYTTVRLKANDGTTYYYLHLHPTGMRVKQGQRVEKGDPIGYLSNIMGGKRGTTIHLHFAARQTVEVNGTTQSVYLPVYTSLIAALRRAKGLGPSIDSDGNLIVDANYEIGATPVVVPEPEPQPDPVPQPDPGGTPDPVPGDGDALSVALARIEKLDRELNELKVRSDREIAAAQDEARDALTELRQTQEKLTAAQARIETLERDVVQTGEAGAAREAELKRELDSTAVTLAQVRAELDQIKQDQARPGIWQRTKDWIGSILKSDS